MPASSTRRSLLVGLVALTLAASSAGARQQTDPDAINSDNYFVANPGPAGGRTGRDPFDPYAPVDTGTLPVPLAANFTATTGIAEAWAPPPSPGLPGRPY
ncbi:MAG: hypothetical protein M3R02_06645 [Chloroflexota bacterium]|nr:hypothetical protein [Chloroflexota bacterium]